jgi:acetyl-CoA synthetase
MTPMTSGSIGGDYPVSADTNRTRIRPFVTGTRGHTPRGWDENGVCKVDALEAPIRKPASLRVPPNLADYAQERADFDWSQALARLDLLADGGWNIAFEAVDRHVAAGAGDRVALRWLSRQGGVEDIEYRTLAERTARFASGLARLGVLPGERVFVLAPRIPELYVAVLGALKHGAVVAPLFSAFGPEPIHTRMTLGSGVALVTTDQLYRRKVTTIRDRLPELRHVIIVVHQGGRPDPRHGRLRHDVRRG